MPIPIEAIRPSSNTAAWAACLLALAAGRYALSNCTGANRSHTVNYHNPFCSLAHARHLMLSALSVGKHSTDAAVVPGTRTLAGAYEAHGTGGLAVQL